MAQLFGRSVRLIIGSTLIEGLRAQFKIKKTATKEPNECELSIWNLSETSRAALQAKGTRIIVEAGYISTASVIFAGDSSIIDHKHEGPDWISRIQCGDGERAFKFATLNQSFGPGVSVLEVFKKAAGQLVFKGVSIDNAVKQAQTELTGQFTQGYVLSGRAFSAAAQLAESYGLELSIQDGQLQLIRRASTTQDQAVVLSASTGLIGSPEHGTPAAAAPDGRKKPQVLKAKSLLQPGIRAGGRVRIEAESPGNNGDFKVLTVVHDGDTHGGSWYSEIEAVPVS